MKPRRRGRTHTSRKNQPQVPAAGARRLHLVDKHAGEAAGVYPPRYLEQLRNEWH